MLGWAEFRGLRIAVDPSVFVPRRRTEFLAGQAVTLARPGAVVVDLCCGSGALAAALAAAVPEPKCTPLTSTRRGALRAAQPGRRGRQVYQGDLFGPLPAGLAAGWTSCWPTCLTCPPAKSGCCRRSPRPRGRVALDGGADGLHVLRRVAAEAPGWLAPGGWLLSEISERQVAAATAAVTAAGLTASVARSAEHGATVLLAARPAGPGPRRRWTGMAPDALPLDALPRQLARTRRFSLGHPARAIVSPDGRTVFFLPAGPGTTQSAACGRWTG